MNRMRTSMVAAVATISSLAAGVGSGAAVEASATRCVPVRATGIGQDLGNFQTQADIYVLGVKVGSTAATFAPTGQTGTIVSFSGPILFNARFGLGSLTVSAVGSVDISSGVFVSAGPISATTGIFKGASGNLSFQGTEDLSTGAFSERVTGSICATNPAALRAIGTR